MTTPSNLWDARYGGETWFYGTAPNDFLAAEAHRFKPGGAVVSLAEGEGRNAVHLAGLGLKVTGVDASVVGLDKARRLAKLRGVAIQTVVADLAGFEFGEQMWDGVVSIWCHLPSALRDPLHRKIVAALRPGGLVLFEHYHPKQLAYGTGGPKDPDLLLTLDELRGAFAGFETLHAFEGERMVNEGEGHTGLSHVTQFIARKPL
jgi:SAM-dependent methyltransferase